MERNGRLQTASFRLRSYSECVGLRWAPIALATCGAAHRAAAALSTTRPVDRRRAAVQSRCSWAEQAAAVWISCGLPKGTAGVAALRNAILQKQKKKRMTFQIACSVCFEADKSAINTEPGELISENLISAMQKFSSENPLQATSVTAEKQKQLSVTAVVSQEQPHSTPMAPK